MAKQGGQTQELVGSFEVAKLPKGQRLRLKLLQNANETNYMIRDKKCS